MAIISRDHKDVTKVSILEQVYDRYQRDCKAIREEGTQLTPAQIETILKCLQRAFIFVDHFFGVRKGPTKVITESLFAMLHSG